MEILEITKKNEKKFSFMMPERFVERENNIKRICLGIQENELPLGVLIFYLFEADYRKCASVQWLYVSPKFRKAGLGSVLVDYMMQILENIQAEEVCCIIHEEKEYKDIIIRMLLKKGYSLHVTERKHYEISYKDVLRLAKEESDNFHKNSTGILPLKLLNSSQIRSFENLQSNNPSYYSDRINNQNYNYDISMAYVERDEVKAIMLWSDQHESGIYLDFLYSSLQDPHVLGNLVTASALETLSYIASRSVDEIEHCYVKLDAINRKTEKLVERIMDHARGIADNQYQLTWSRSL